MRDARDDGVRRLREGARIEAEPREGVEQDRRRHDAADQPRHRAIIGAPDPDADGVPAVEADGPGVAIAIGGAGLVGDAAGRGVERRRRAEQRLGDIPGGDGLDEARRLAAAVRHRAFTRSSGTSPPRASPT